jgi:ABC-type glycerol-3-phosphate transport system substrate-binding protein
MSSIAGDLNRIHVMSGGAPKEVFALLAPKFEQQTGNKVQFTYAVITELREKLDAGARADDAAGPCRPGPIDRSSFDIAAGNLRLSGYWRWLVSMMVKR